VGLGFLALAVLLGTPWSEGIVFAIGVAVALVPEALLPTVTLSLAIGAQRMAHRHALVRRLEAVETLGSTTFICTDKTGTLTRNEMTVVEVWTPTGSAALRGGGYGPIADVTIDDGAVGAVRDLARDAARCTTGRAVADGDVWSAKGDPMDAACWALARRVGAAPEDDDRPERARFPFDAERRRLSVIVADRLVTKGAPDGILALAATVTGATASLDDMTSRGLRVLAVATRRIGTDLPTDARSAEVELELQGLLGFQDPPRPEVADAVAACRRAGIRVAMVTGDHPATALAVARQVGLADGASSAVSGDELPADEQVLGAMVDRDGIVLARVTPEQKLRIARALRSRGHVVAMTGDGVNDGPALQEADIGIAMGRSGTDVAREAADLVLLDDDFATIVAAVELGRASFANTRRFLTYHLTDNVAELTPFVVWALSGGRIPLALTVLQILALDLGTDTLSATALGAERPSARALTGDPVRGHLLDRTVAIRAFGVLGPVEAVFEMAAFFATFVAAGWRPGAPFPEGATLAVASGAAFTTVVLPQTANAWACRSVSVPAWRIPPLSNRLLVGGALVELAIAAVLLWSPTLGDVLRHAVPGAAGWIVAIGAAAAVIVADGVWKAVRTRR
jgi:magnesium-transporting ATPase (P-type)